MQLSLDTETTGVDLKHGAKPFLVTTCSEEGENIFWEWPVNPITREPHIPKEDIADIKEMIVEADELILHNARFDVSALNTIDPWFGENWPWAKTHDTLIAGHLVATDDQHDLASMFLQYCGGSIFHYEEAMRKACLKARHRASTTYPSWQIATKDLACMPSAKEKTWKFDMWLLRSIAKRERYKKDHDWYTLTSRYANGDSSATLLLWNKLQKLLTDRVLWPIYYERMKLVPVIWKMEQRGVTANEERAQRLQQRYADDAMKLANTCVKIADKYDYELKLPKSGNSKALLEFSFDFLKLPEREWSNKTGNPSLNKDVLEGYVTEFNEDTNEHQFAKSLLGKRKCDTSLNYLAGYKRFWLPIKGPWKRLYPSLNPTGTRTLRLSSSNPNAQNVSKLEEFGLRSVFGPLPGREWWSLDYNNLELRIPAYESQEPAMLELFENPERPPYYGSYHLLIFSILHPDKYDHDDPEGLVKAKDEHKATWYQWTKNGNFAELYGAIEKSGTADRAFHVPGAQRIVAERLTEKSRLNQYWIGYAEKHGHVLTMPDKTMGNRAYPINVGRDRYGKVQPTTPLNYHVQGTACWIAMRAMIKVQEYFESMQPRFNAYLIMNVHDELVIDMPFRKNKGNLPKVRRVRQLMESIGKDIDVPLTCDMQHHPHNWGEKE